MASAPPPHAADPASRIRALADQCVLCGLCLPHCPTYRLDQVESESPRGRIMLAQALADARLPAGDAAATTALDHCLGCRTCEAVCPAGVQYGELLAATRAMTRHASTSTKRQRALERLTRHPALLSRTLRLLQRLRPLLPRRLRAPLPRRTRHRTASGTYEAIGTRRGRVALFLGCVARTLDADVQHAAIRVLTSLGWDVGVPRDQGCCGALHRHAGDAQTEAQLARINAQAFDTAAFDAVIVSASGCWESLRFALHDGPPVRELLEFVASDERLAELHFDATTQRIALHVPCTQRNVVGAGDAAALALRRIPHLTTHALPPGCCGAAGTHMLEHPQRAAALRAPLLDAIAAHAPDVVCSGNIGCRMHLSAGLDERNGAPSCRHPIEVLAACLR